MEAVLDVGSADPTLVEHLMRLVTERATFDRVILSLILPGKNPREHFDPIEAAAMDANVREIGVHTPILLRLKDGKFYLIAGERRLRAARNVMYDGYRIPAMIAEMTDEEADILSSSENTARIGMSPTEEAVAASNVLGTTKGNRDLAAKLLGWSRGTLDNRLALMNCSPAVRTALNQREINLGHAELLAALPKATQDRLLPVILSEKKTVSEIKNVIAHAACKLEVAIFNKDECVSCPHNSTLQKSFFAENIGDGGCTNRGCYEKKSEDALAEKVVSLKDEYPVIRIVRVGDNSTSIKLVANGTAGVGPDQAEACRGCADFGAAVSALPDAMGVVYKERCFNTTCNSEKVAAFKAASTPPETTETTVQTTSAGGTVVGTTKAKKTEPVAVKAATKVSESERVKTYREKLWRSSMKKVLSSSSATSLHCLLAICIDGRGRNISGSSLTKAFSKLTGNEGSLGDLFESCQSVSNQPNEVLNTMTTLLAASAMEDIEISSLTKLSKFVNLDLTQHWKLDAEFLEILTKSEIELIAKEIGLSKHFGDDFKKLSTEKKPDMIKKLLAVESFDYSQKIPKIIQP